MRRAQDIAAEEADMSTIVGLTSVFEGLASMRIAQTKTRVLESQVFFNELWHMYAQLRVDSLFRFGRLGHDEVMKKTLLIAITAEGSFSGDIDHKLITTLLKDYDPAKHELVIIGHHGAVQLTQAKVEYLKFYKLPEKDTNINVQPLVQLIKQYQATTVYYQTYVSLMVQDVKRIPLQNAVQLAGNKAGKNSDVISEKTYIFEPSNYAVVAHLERSMLEITLSQAILDSKLAQYASRFRAMSVAHDRSSDSLQDLHLLYNRTKRTVADERLKEILNGRKRVVA
jgi:F-type H+-transporting ATPase subunit gamma